MDRTRSPIYSLTQKPIKIIKTIDNNNNSGNTANNTQPLFGLTPAEINYIFSDYFDRHNQCSVAIMEIVSEAYLNQKKSEDTSILTETAKAVSVHMLLDKMEDTLRKFEIHCSTTEENPQWFNIAAQDPEKKKAATDLHNYFVKIITQIKQIGYIKYNFLFLCAIDEIKTKQAYQDISHAYAITQILYNAYIKSKWNFNAAQCLIHSNNNQL